MKSKQGQSIHKVNPDRTDMLGENCQVDALKTGNHAADWLRSLPLLLLTDNFSFRLRLISTTKEQGQDRKADVLSATREEAFNFSFSVVDTSTTSAISIQLSTPVFDGKVTSNKTCSPLTRLTLMVGSFDVLFFPSWHEFILDIQSRGSYVHKYTKRRRQYTAMYPGLFSER